MYDVQLTEFPFAEPDFLTGPVLMSESRMLVVPSNHPLARREFLSYEDLTRITLLAPLGEVPSYWLDAHFPDHTPSGAPIRREQAFTHWQEALALVASGRGAVISAAQGAQYYDRPGVTYVPFDDAPPIEYGLVWRRAGNTARVAEFTRAAREVALATPR
ncbi:LysR substrate-binding domain-containing protein [Streptomyces sp. H27-C3]|uniref:LysR substrate-binding domain-containing protein n=1 Tax=Streptomyces sp. H27-C3 TaxID=3046305 RepID=UPI0024BA341B|nr:LysR substrate-binding domain-containing protein [Streptomyces sp. H27-C3]MDJ0465472.1 LysR substrate-binding domain-containing protein [Streptomyces sp. H27-C3]